MLGRPWPRCGGSGGMSKHFFRGVMAGGVRVLVDAGWDRPLGYHYLNVERLDVGMESEERLVYASLYDPELFGRERGQLRGGMSVAEVEAKLAALGVVVPAGMVEALREDQRLNVGNAVREWS